MNSLTPEAIDRVNAKKEDWMLTVDVDGTDTELACGVCLLKVILTISQQETRSTLAHVIKRLNELGPLMIEVEYNIQTINVRVNDLIHKPTPFLRT